jgi:Mrp family chromosome partitioning ATPase
MHEPSSQNPEEAEINESMGRIKNKIMIMSNKGGVGKSTVSANLAVSLAKKGFKTGLLDIDLHGPSQAQLFGLKDKKHTMIDDKIQPFRVGAIKLITTAGLIEDEGQPLIWRGPLKISLIKQFIKDSDWGELDYLLIDSPPGTGDEPLTIGQIVPNLTGVILVTTPQELAILDSQKAINFARKLNVPILGWIENMALMTCPHCGKEISLFAGEDTLFTKEGIELLGKLPFEPTLLLDMQRKNAMKTPIDDIFDSICEKITSSMPTL